MNDYNSNAEILQDLNSKGKPKPWREKKLSTLDLSKSYGRLKLGNVKIIDEITDCEAHWKEKYANYEPMVNECASYLEFNADGRLVQMYTCKRRLCAMCNWRKSIKVFTSVSKVMDVIEEQKPDLQPVFLTLTQKNCAFDELEPEIRRIFDNFHRLVNHRRVKSQVIGWFRAFEVTYNKKTDTWHPHLHLILLYEKKYFKKENKHYMNQDDWVHVWQTSSRLDYAPNVDIRKLEPKKKAGKRKCIAEATKYVMKEKTILTKDLKSTDRLVDCLTKALHHKRLFSFGGLMKKVAKELKLDKPDDGNLIHVGDEQETIREDVSKVLTAYRWDFGLLNYKKVTK